MKRVGFRPARLALVTVLTTAALLRADINLLNNQADIVGPIQVRLAYTDKNGNGQDFALQQLPAAVSQTLPAAWVNLTNTPLLQGTASPHGYFDNAWNSVRNAVCGDVAGEVPTMINTQDNQAYNASCQTTATGVLQAIIVNQWEDQYLAPHTGTRLTLDYWVPANSVTFSVRTPTTGCYIFCQPDPKFTVVFDAHLIVRASTDNWSTLKFPPVIEHYGEVIISEVLSGDQTAGVVSAGQQFEFALAGAEASSAIAGGPLDPVGLGIAAAVLAEEIGAIAVSDIANADLRDEVSADLSFINSPSAGGAGAQIGQDFTGFYQALNTSSPFSPGGLANLAITGGNNGSLIFRFTAGDPPPVLSDGRVRTTGPSLIAPTIGATQTDVVAGQSLTILGDYFTPAYTTHLPMYWSTSVGVPAQSTLLVANANPLVLLQTIQTSQFSFVVTNLTPGRAYQFRVSECGQISCSPWSNWLDITTDAAGTDQVTFSLDQLSNKIGPATTLGIGGSFSAAVTIPSGTTPGTHTLYATVGAQQASMQITVCISSGCPPTLVELNPDTGQAETQPGIVVQGSSIVLAGSNFTPGQTVTISVDPSNVCPINILGQSTGPCTVVLGPTLGSATVGANGSFKGTFVMPGVTLGTHNLGVTEAGVGSVLATYRIYVEAPAQ
jgi:hypothetical protein